MTVHEYVEQLSSGSQDGYHVLEATNKWDEEDRLTVVDAIKGLSSVANHSSARKLADHIVDAIQADHRYLQGELISALIGALSRYSQASYDGRNLYAVACCKVIDDLAYEQALGAFKNRPRFTE